MCRLQLVCVQPAVPVHRHAGEVLLGRLVGVEAVRPLDEVVLVVVEADDLDAGLLLLQHRPKVILHELRLVLRRPKARLPPDRRLRLVLHSHAPHINAVRAVRRDELGEVLGPWTHHRGHQAVRTGRRGERLLAIDRLLHPRGHRPRRGEQSELRAALGDRVLRRLDHRDHARSHVVLNCRVEVLQFHVVLHVVEGVRGGAEVTRVYRHTAQRVAVPALLGAGEVETDDLGLVFRGQAFPVER
mmetsp:Transcript_15210/g.36427  ORF Transcript_15210/g.36427 Transcript_15210/m.36427 type:complete len:243 (-) Transcript_15210:216-944(-)